jgi:hypothetical protein
MKKSARVTLTIVAALGLAACRRRSMDPCDAGTFNAEPCQQAIHNGGYYYGGYWHRGYYPYSYPYYYDNYHSHVLRGGTVRSSPSASYSGPSSGVARGGFGSTGRGMAGS